MVINSRSIIRDFIGRYPLSANQLNEWYDKTKQASWGNFSQVKSTFGSCDFIGNDRFVFNIGGNNLRLVAMIFFKKRILYIRGVFTHEEYDRLSKRGELQTL
jgi:mRNA interferase HigB